MGKGQEVGEASMVPSQCSMVLWSRCVALMLTCGVENMADWHGGCKQPDDHGIIRDCDVFHKGLF